VNDEDRTLLSKIALLIVILMLVQLAVIGYVFFAQYQGRKDTVTTLRAGCERGKADRRANAQVAQADANNWLKAAGVRRRDNDTAVADAYEANAAKQEAVAQALLVRAQIDCVQAFPKARFLR